MQVMSDFRKFGEEEALAMAKPLVEPSAEYLEHVRLIENVVGECIHVSHGYGHIRAPTSRHFYATVLFTALLGRGVSLAQIAPYSTWAIKNIEHWDYASVFIIVRTMIEIRAAFHYLCVDPCSEAEWNCRWNLLNLHDCVSRKRMFEAYGDKPEQVAGFAIQADELRERLRANAHFQGLPNQKRLLNGQIAYLYPLEDILEKAGVEKAVYRPLHVFFSSHVHGLPMSFYRMGVDGEDDRGRGVVSPIEMSYTMMGLAFAATLLTGTRDEMHVLFKGLVQGELEPGIAPVD